MAIFRKIHTSFWSDGFTSELDKDQKLFYLYILTNERTKQCGVYEITKKQMSFDLGYSIDTISKLLKYFISKGKIRYNEDTKELAVGNWLKYNQSTSPKVQQCINKEFKCVKDTVLIEYVKSMDTDPQEEQEEEKKEEQEEEKNKNEPSLILPFSSKEFVDVWNVLIKEKKWKNKSLAALQASAEKLSKVSEQDAIQMMKNSIAGGWQSVFELKNNNNNGKGQSNYHSNKTDVAQLVEATKSMLGANNGNDNGRGN